MVMAAKGKGLKQRERERRIYTTKPLSSVLMGLSRFISCPIIIYPHTHRHWELDNKQLRVEAESRLSFSQHNNVARTVQY